MSLPVRTSMQPAQPGPERRQDCTSVAEIASSLAHLTTRLDPGDPELRRIEEAGVRRSHAAAEAVAGRRPKRPDAASGRTCPECHGSLWLLEEVEGSRLECRLGHAFCLNSFMSEQGEAVEVALRSAINSLQEHAAAYRRLAAGGPRGRREQDARTCVARSSSSTTAALSSLASAADTQSPATRVGKMKADPSGRELRPGRCRGRRQLVTLNGGSWTRRMGQMGVPEPVWQPLVETPSLTLSRRVGTPTPRQRRAVDLVPARWGPRRAQSMRLRTPERPTQISSAVWMPLSPFRRYDPYQPGGPCADG